MLVGHFHKLFQRLHRLFEFVRKFRVLLVLPGISKGAKSGLQGAHSILQIAVKALELVGKAPDLLRVHHGLRHISFLSRYTKKGVLIVTQVQIQTVAQALAHGYFGVVQESTPEGKAEESALIFNEIQLILSEKRTSLSALRTGIAVFVLPLSVLSALVATSRYYDFRHAARLLVPLLILNAGLIVLGAYLIFHAIRRIHHYDRLIREIKRKHSAIAEFID